MEDRDRHIPVLRSDFGYFWSSVGGSSILYRYSFDRLFGVFKCASCRHYVLESVKCASSVYFGYSPCPACVGKFTISVAILRHQFQAHFIFSTKMAAFLLALKIKFGAAYCEFSDAYSGFYSNLKRFQDRSSRHQYGDQGHIWATPGRVNKMPIYQQRQLCGMLMGGKQH